MQHAFAYHFTNNASIKIKDNAPASIFPSTIGVFGMDGYIKQVTITIHNVTHKNYHDVHIVLQGPEGQSILLQSGISKQGSKISQVTYTLKDGWPNLPLEKEISSSIYKPTQYQETPSFTYPAPKSIFLDEDQGYALPGPLHEQYASLNAVFGGRQANGLWKLYVQDMVSQDEGIIVNGWSLDIEMECYKEPQPEKINTPILATNDLGLDFLKESDMMKVAISNVTSQVVPEKMEASTVFQEIAIQRENMALPSLVMYQHVVHDEKPSFQITNQFIPLKARRPYDEMDFLKIVQQISWEKSKLKGNLHSEILLLSLQVQRLPEVLDNLSSAHSTPHKIQKEKHTWVKAECFISLGSQLELQLPNDIWPEDKPNEIKLEEFLQPEKPNPKVIETMESLAKKFDPSLEDVKFLANQKMREAYLIVNGVENELCTLKIFDAASGEAKWEQKYKMRAGVNSIYISTGKLDSGSYNLIYNLGDHTGIVKFQQ